MMRQSPNCCHKPPRIVRHLSPWIPGIVNAKDHSSRHARWLQELDDETLREYFIFSFARNPWDRVVSLDCYFRLPLKRFPDQFDSSQKKQTIREHCLPIYASTHCGGVQFADFVGRFENLQRDFEHICDRIGLKRLRLPLSNSTQHKHYRVCF